MGRIKMSNTNNTIESFEGVDLVALLAEVEPKQITPFELNYGLIDICKELIQMRKTVTTIRELCEANRDAIKGATRKKSSFSCADYTSVYEE